jgi:hypothetical protein
MTLVELLQQAARQPLTTPKGKPVPLKLKPGLAQRQIAKIEARMPCPIPSEERELLAFCAGFTGGAVDFVDFTGRHCMFEYEDAFPHGHPIAADGAGNFWVVDLLPESQTWGPIYYASHDPPIILYQSPTLGAFLTELFKASMPPYRSLVEDVHEDRLFNVWRANPGLVSYSACLDSGDPDLVAFAEDLDESFVRLRQPC